MILPEIVAIARGSLDSAGVRSFGGNHAKLNPYYSGRVQARFWLNISAFLSVVVFTVLVVLVIIYREESAYVIAFCSALGISAAGAIATIIKVAARLHQMAVLEEILGELPPEDQRSLYLALLRAEPHGQPETAPTTN